MQTLYEFRYNLLVYQYSYYSRIKLFVNIDLNRFNVYLNVIKLKHKTIHKIEETVD
jgi:hypothetical protein